DRPRGSRSCSSAGSTRCRSARAFRRRDTNSLGPADDRVRDPGPWRTGDDVSGPELVLFAITELHVHQLERAAALEHDEGLGLGRVAMGWGAAFAVFAPDPVEAGPV